MNVSLIMHAKECVFFCPYFSSFHDLVIFVPVPAAAKDSKESKKVKRGTVTAEVRVSFKGRTQPQPLAYMTYILDNYQVHSRAH